MKRYIRRTAAGIMVLCAALSLMIAFGMTAFATETDTTVIDSQPADKNADSYALQTPGNVEVVKNRKSKLEISWDKVSGATSYSVYCVLNNGDEILAKKTDKTSYTHKKYVAGNIYTYYVVAMDDKGGASKKSEPAYYFEDTDITVNGTFTKKKKVKLTWDEIPAAQSYVIYKKNSNGKYKIFAKTDDTEFVDSSIKKGKTNKYKVSYVFDKPDGKKFEKLSGVVSVYGNVIDPNKKMVALTFDDGPGRYTQEIVDCLKENDARATFFVLGCNIDSYKSAVKNANKIGCEIANHSYSHAMLYKLSASQIKSEISNTDAKIKKITGSKAAVCRTPGGGISSTVKSSVGKPIILWSIDTLDWKTRNTEKTISAVMNNVKDGDIVLMHDIHEPTKRAALSIIPQLKKKGYQLVTVSELAEYRGYKLSNGGVYHSLRKKKK